MRRPRSLAIGLLAAAAMAAFAGTQCFAQADAPLPEMALGQADAPVTVIEYSSLSCPHCAAFHKKVLPVLKSRYIDTGKVRFIVREFPSNEAGFAGAVVARCLDPSRFFSFTELLFARQDDWAFKKDVITPLKLFAKQAGLPESQFNKCIDDEELQKKVLAVRDQGARMGVNGTPAIFVNQKQIRGAPVLETLEQAIRPYIDK
jgi:protein-disulfide isomerase